MRRKPKADQAAMLAGKDRFEAWLSVQLEADQHERAKHDAENKRHKENGRGVIRWCAFNASPERKAMARTACQMTKQERDELQTQAFKVGPDSNATGEEIRADPVKRRSEQQRQALSDRVIAWDVGETERLRRNWLHDAQKKARAIIGGRVSEKRADLKPDEFTVSGAKGDGALMLPVVYECFRQSERCLQWAILWHSLGGIKLIMGDVGHDLTRRMEVEKMDEQLRPQIGRGWVDAMRALVDFLAWDTPFSAVPMAHRQQAAKLAVDSSHDNIAFNLDFETVDGGCVKFEPFARMIGRAMVRPAHVREATQKGGIVIHHAPSKNETRRPSEAHQYSDALKATTIESLMRSDDSGRCIDELGSEIIALRINWNGTRNTELGNAFAALAAQLRPNQWPEIKERRGNRTKDARAALGAVIRAVNSKGVGLDGKAQKIALKWFQGITGETVLPWWDKRLKSK